MPDFHARVRHAMSAAGHPPDEDILEELAQHAAAVFETARAEGCDAAEADRRVAEHIARWRAERAMLQRRPKRQAAVTAPPASSRFWTGVMHDVTYGLRVLRRRPATALVAVLTMALGIGASVTLFSVTYGVLLKPLPWVEPDRLVRLSESRGGHTPRVRGTITNGTFIAWHASPSTIEAIGGWRTSPVTAVFGTGDDATQLLIAYMTPSTFTVLRAIPLHGRVLIEDDGRAGASFPAADVIVLSYGLWQERFGGRDAIGAAIQIGGKPITVVGVMPRDFAFPDRGTRAWMPWAVNSVIGEQNVRRMSIFSGMARLRPGATPAQASAEGTARARSAPDPGLAAVAMFGGSGPPDIAAVPAVEMMTAEVRPALLVLLAAVGLLLLTSTANVASVQLARAATRRREMAIRAAIGAGAGRLTRQLVVESLLVGLAGGAAGVLLAAALHAAMPSLLPADFPRADELAMDARVMLFAIAVTIGSGVMCGLLPALHARRTNLVASLADAGAAPVGIGLRSATSRARTWIMVGQIAVSCVLLVGAVLLGRSFLAMLYADRGYDPANVLTARMSLPAAFPILRKTDLLEGITADMRRVPGVTSAAYGNALPFLTSGGFRAFKMRPPRDPSAEIDVNTIQRVVSPGYFTALGLRLISGRIFEESDTAASQMVVVVNRSFAARYLGDDPLSAVVPNLGMCRGDNDRWQVVGVVDDMRQGGLAEPPQPELYMPFKQVGCDAAVATPIIVVRTSDDPSGHVAALRRATRERAPFAALDSVMTLEDRVTSSLARPRLYAVVLIGFGAVAVTITAVGLFGVLSFTVAQRAREIGVRTALGARPADIVTLVVRQGLTIALIGIAAGLLAASASSSAIARVLYGVGAHDVLTFAVVAVALALISAIACIIPARRAARIDPLEVLRAG